MGTDFSNILKENKLIVKVQFFSPFELIKNNEELGLELKNGQSFVQNQVHAKHTYIRKTYLFPKAHNFIIVEHHNHLNHSEHHNQLHQHDPEHKGSQNSIRSISNHKKSKNSIRGQKSLHNKRLNKGTKATSIQKKKNSKRKSQEAVEEDVGGSN